jgi:hypothetical protein
VGLINRKRAEKRLTEMILTKGIKMLAKMGLFRDLFTDVLRETLEGKLILNRADLQRRSCLKRKACGLLG